MSDTELTEEQLKEQKLEDARKKYEALKKKTKKKNKKSKQKESDDADAKEGTPESDLNKEDTPATEGEVPEETEVESELLPSDDTQIAEENKTATESEVVIDGDLDETVVAAPAEEGKNDAVTEEATTTPLEPIDQITEGIKNTDLTEQPDDNPFASSGPSFLEIIEQAKNDDELKRLKQENLQLKFDKDELEEKIHELTRENKELKFVKLDHQEQIETLEQQVSDLQSKLARAKVDSSTLHQQGLSTPYDFDENLSLSPTPSYTQPPAPPSFGGTSFSQFNLARNDSTLSLTEVRARLNKWKGWNVDMTTWRTVGSGPVIDL